LNLGTVCLVICALVIFTMLPLALESPSKLSPYTRTSFNYQPNAFSQQAPQREKKKFGCEHTNQGKVFITDDRGYTCKWKDLEPVSSCCKELEETSLDAMQRYSCDTCNSTTLCCSVYEFCVSCCMDPNITSLRQQHASLQSTVLRFVDLSSSFDLCRAVCRTSSKSIYDKNKYKHDDKHCYGLVGPPVETSDSGELPSAPSQTNIKSTESPQLSELPGAKPAKEEPSQNVVEMHAEQPFGMSSTSSAHVGVATTFTDASHSFNNSASLLVSATIVHFLCILLALT